MKEAHEHIRDLEQVNIRFAGQGGQGVILMAYLFGQAVIFNGFNASQTQKYGPETRGTPVKSDLIIKKKGIITYPLFRNIDYLITMSQASYDLNNYKTLPNGFIILDTSMVKVFKKDHRTYGIPATKMAKEKFGNTMLSNVIMLGYFNRITREFIPNEIIMKSIKTSIKKKFIQKNLDAFMIGFSYEGNDAESGPKNIAT
ncbi:MAG: 2-oxoacid:acceptor oxidoreductase family protein [Promethearchaeota archaeon]